MALYMFDDQSAREWAPFTLTRPAGELMFGCLLLRERAARFWGEACAGHLTNPALEGFHEPGAPPVIPFDDLGVGAEEPVILFSSRAVPDIGAPAPSKSPATLMMDGQVVGWILPADGPSPSERDLFEPESVGLDLPPVEVSGRVLDAPWELMSGNGDQVSADIPALFPESRFNLPDGVHCTGAGRISLGSNVHLEAGVHLDATEGPIRLSDGARVLAFTRLAGPAFVGPASTLLGGAFQKVGIGPVCKIRGEVESSVFLGYGNKAHDGYLGHAYIGKWVNLGALTTNSDLKNNYGTIRVPTPRGLVDTGLVKLGCLMGDHVKTGIGTLLTTGTVVGAGSNLFGGLMPPKSVPAFSWGVGQELEEYDLDKFLEVAERVMARREIALTPESRALLRKAWERSRPDRA